LDCLASYLAAQGLTARVVFPFLYGRTIDEVVAGWADTFRPRAIGVNLRNIDPYIPVDPMGEPFGPHVRSRWFVPAVQQVVESLRRHFPGRPIVLGGTGFTMIPGATSEALGCPAGVLGPGETEFLAFVRAADGAGAEGLESRFGIRQGTPVIPPVPVVHASEFRFALARNGIPLRTKVGCNRACSYCTDPLIDGKRVIPAGELPLDQLHRLARDYPDCQQVFLTDSEFNLPAFWCELFSRAVIDHGLAGRFQFATQILPRPFEATAARMLAAAGFKELLITIDGFDDGVHAQNRKSYRSNDAFQCIRLCHEHEITPVLQNVFGLPGETRESLRKTLATIARLQRDYPTTQVEFTVGARIYPGTYLERIARSQPGRVYGEWSPGMLKPIFYSASYPPRDLAAAIEDALGLAPTLYTERHEATLAWRVALAYAADSSDWLGAAQLLGAIPTHADSIGLADEVFLAIDHSFRVGGLPLLRHVETILDDTPLDEAARAALAAYRDLILGRSGTPGPHQGLQRDAGVVSPRV
jgi:hypothetical protein